MGISPGTVLRSDQGTFAKPHRTGVLTLMPCCLQRRLHAAGRFWVHVVDRMIESWL